MASPRGLSRRLVVLLAEADAVGLKGAGKEQCRALERAEKERRDALAREKKLRHAYSSHQRLSNPCRVS